MVEYDLKQRIIDSKSEFENIMTSNDTKNILLNNSESNNNFYIYDIKVENNVKYRIGLCTEGHGLNPQCIINKRLFIGADRYVYIIDMDKFNIINTIHLICSLFYEFKVFEKEGIVILIHELGINALSTDGTSLWHIDTNLVVDIIFKDEVIEVITDENIFRVDLFSGKILKY